MMFDESSHIKYAVPDSSRVDARDATGLGRGWGWGLRRTKKARFSTSSWLSRDLIGKNTREIEGNVNL